MNHLIYLSDNDTATRKAARTYLRKEGFQVETFTTGDRLYEAFKEKKCDIAILDNLLICAKIKQFPDQPVIMLTAQACDDDYVFGLSVGIDAYLPKPFNPAKLVAHIHSLLTKTKMPVALRYSDITMCPSKRTIHCDSKELRLTNTEFSLLSYLLKNQDSAISRNELISNIWGEKRQVGVRATDDTIKRLRHKLNKAGSQAYIETVWGFGFKLGVRGE